MMCRNCRQARSYAGDSVYCILYGMIISDTHECPDEKTLLPWEKEETEKAPADADADARKKGIDPNEV